MPQGGLAYQAPKNTCIPPMYTQHVCMHRACKWGALRCSVKPYGGLGAGAAFGREMLRREAPKRTAVGTLRVGMHLLLSTRSPSGPQPNMHQYPVRKGW